MFEEAFHTVTSDGFLVTGRLFIPEGNGPFPCVVLLHGFGATFGDGMYPAILRGLASSGVVGVGFQFGGEEQTSSDTEFITMSYPRCVSEANAVLDLAMHHPLVDAARVGLCGHSMGGMITMATASQRPDLRALAIICTPWDPQGELLALWNTTPANWRDIGFMELSELHFDWGLGARKLDYHFYESWGAYDSMEIVPVLPQPTMVVYGQRDAIVAAERAQLYFEALNSEKKLVPIERGDHTFTNPGTLEEMVGHVTAWFAERLGIGRNDGADAVMVK